MTSKEAIMIQNKTQKIIESLWQCDFSPLLKHIAEDVTLIDPGRHILIQGREKILALLPQISEDISQSTLRRHTFMIAQNCGNACTIIGQYELDDGRSIRSQSCVCVWESTQDGKLMLKHIGISKPDDTALPKSPAARDITPDRRSPRIVITDQNDCTRFLYPQSILFATSDGRNTIIREYHRIHCEIRKRFSTRTQMLCCECGTYCTYQTLLRYPLRWKRDTRSGQAVQRDQTKDNRNDEFPMSRV